MKMLGITEKLRWAVLNQPTLIPSIVNDPRYDKATFQHILYEMLPRRTSIEIEATNSLAKGINMNNNDIKKEKYFGGIQTHIYPHIAKKYNVYEYAEDDRGTIDPSSYQTIDYDEHKISIINYTQLVGLYNILTDMKKHCMLTTNSGCHIHLDVSKTLKRFNDYQAIKSFFTKKCRNGTIEKIFGPRPNDGDPARMACETSKGYWIHLNLHYQSLEFRTGAMTFDYSTIVSWYISINKLLTEFENTRMVQVNASPKKARRKVHTSHSASNVIEQTVRGWIPLTNLQL